MFGRWSRIVPIGCILWISLASAGARDECARILRAQRNLPTIRLCWAPKRCITVEVAATPRSRQYGLMCRDRLDRHRGMLFVFPREDFWTFWMKNTRIPLDIVWLDPYRRITYMIPDVPPCRKDPCPTYRPMKKARYVLEVRAGSIRRWHWDLGLQFDFIWPPDEQEKKNEK